MFLAFTTQDPMGPKGESPECARSEDAPEKKKKRWEFCIG